MMGLESEIRTALERVKATEDMKQDTLRYLAAQRKRGRVRRRYPLAVAAALALVALGAVGWQVMVRTPVASVSVDVNPSVELALHRLDRVVSATAYNADAQAVLAAVDLEGKPCPQAIDALLESDAMSPYLTGPYALTVTVAAPTAGEEADLLAQLHVCESYRTNGGQSASAELSTLAEAHDHGMSFGKYAAARLLQSYDSTVTDADCHHMTMSQLQARINTCEHGSGAGYGYAHHGSHHHGGGHE